MNRALITTLFCSVACTEVPSSDANLHGPDDSIEEAMMMVEGTVETQSSKSDINVFDPESKDIGILSDHSMSLNVPRTEQAAHQASSIDLDAYLESSDAFAKHLSHAAHSFELTDEELQHLIRLEEQTLCEVDAMIYGKLTIDESERGLFRFEVTEIGSGELVSELDGRVYAGKSTGVMLAEDGTMVAKITAQESEDSLNWTVATGAGLWRADDDAKGERFFVSTDQQIVGFETMCE